MATKFETIKTYSGNGHTVTLRYTSDYNDKAGRPRADLEQVWEVTVRTDSGEVCENVQFGASNKANFRFDEYANRWAGNPYDPSGES